MKLEQLPSGSYRIRIMIDGHSYGQGAKSIRFSKLKKIIAFVRSDSQKCIKKAPRHR